MQGRVGIGISASAAPVWPPSLLLCSTSGPGVAARTRAVCQTLLEDNSSTYEYLISPLSKSSRDVSLATATGLSQSDNGRRIRGFARHHFPPGRRYNLRFQLW